MTFATAKWSIIIWLIVVSNWFSYIALTHHWSPPAGVVSPYDLPLLSVDWLLLVLLLLVAYWLILPPSPCNSIAAVTDLRVLPSKRPFWLKQSQPATFSRTNKQKRQNGSISHLPIASVNFSMHPLATAIDLGSGFIRKVIESPKTCRPKQSATNFRAKQKQKQQKDTINCPPVSHRLIIDAAASCGKSFEDAFIITAVRFPKNPSAAAPRNIFNSKKRQPKAVKTQPCLPVHSRFNSAMAFLSRSGRQELPRHPEKDDWGPLLFVRRRRRAITPSRTAPEEAKQWAGEAAKASSDGDASSEADAAAVASWPQWERLPGGWIGRPWWRRCNFCHFVWSGWWFSHGVVCLGFLFVKGISNYKK